MSDSKKYYYLKLKDNFFDNEAIVVLESMPDGYLYSNILLKLYLRSLKNEGRLMFKDRIPYNPTILAQVTRHKVGVVEKALDVLKQLDLIEIIDNGAIYMTDIQNFIGQSSTEADRKRTYRHKIEAERSQLLVKGQKSDECPDKSPPEIEIEIEKELKRELKPFVEIVSHLNDTCGTKYRSTTKKTQSLIKARMNEGFTVDDFKTVINTMYSHWNEDTSMEIYLRPETLFGTKFESYLNREPFKEIDLDELFGKDM